ncbi:hypothetical protein [Streptosporangium sp. NPDC049304]|uniref:hypothetical protein n=1 Tax=Streptosporangium sp. NPDC049304 TaxID=3154830 RepID=UPI00343D21A1
MRALVVAAQPTRPAPSPYGGTFAQIRSPVRDMPAESSPTGDRAGPKTPRFHDSR